MAAKCGRCAVVLVNNDIVIKCIDCSVSFHSTCTSLASSQNTTKQKIKSWKCELCKGESSSVTSVASEKSNDDASEGTKSILEALRSMDLKINKNISQMRGSIDSLSEEFRKLNTRCAAIEENHVELQRRCDHLEDANERLQKEVEELQQRVIDSEQHSRSANLEIVGLPATTGEDVYFVLGKFADILGVPFVKEDISLAHRLRVFSNKHSHAPLIAQFVSRRVRDTWLAAAKKKRGLKSTQIAASLPESAVFVNEQLTSHNKTLLGRARRMQREKKIHFAGYFNGKVLIKPKEKDASFRVLQLKDLDRFDK